jgi:hypothetical protein
MADHVETALIVSNNSLPVRSFVPLAANIGPPWTFGPSREADRPAAACSLALPEVRRCSSDDLRGARLCWQLTTAKRSCS